MKFLVRIICILFLSLLAFADSMFTFNSTFKSCAESRIHEKVAGNLKEDKKAYARYLSKEKVLDSTLYSNKVSPLSGTIDKSTLPLESGENKDFWTLHMRKELKKGYHEYEYDYLVKDNCNKTKDIIYYNLLSGLLKRGFKTVDATIILNKKYDPKKLGIKFYVRDKTRELEGYLKASVRNEKVSVIKIKALKNLPANTQVSVLVKISN